MRMLRGCEGMPRRRRGQASSRGSVHMRRMHDVGSPVHGITGATRACTGVRDPQAHLRGHAAALSGSKPEFRPCHELRCHLGTVIQHEIAAQHVERTWWERATCGLMQRALRFRTGLGAKPGLSVFRGHLFPTRLRAKRPLKAPAWLRRSAMRYTEGKPNFC